MTNRTKHIINFIREEVERVHGIDPITCGNRCIPAKADFVTVIREIFVMIGVKQIAEHIGRKHMTVSNWGPRKTSKVQKIREAVEKRMEAYDSEALGWREASKVEAANKGEKKYFSHAFQQANEARLMQMALDTVAQLPPFNA